MKIFLTVLILFLNSCYAQTDDEENNSFEPQKIKPGTIKIDGIIKETEWGSASKITSFLELYSNNKPLFNTEAFVLYDSSFLYVAFKSFFKNKETLNLAHYPKDDERNLQGEWVAICLDGYADGLSALFFISNCDGGQIDGSLNMDGSPEMVFSNEWKSAAIVNDKFYVIEMAIPFRDIPFDTRKKDVEMAFKLVRFDAANGREYDYPEFDGNNYSHLSQFRKVRFSGIEKSRVKNLTGVDINALVEFKKSRANLFDIKTFEGRRIALGDASVIDYKIFQKKELPASTKPFEFVYNSNENEVTKIFESTGIEPLNRISDFDYFLERTLTTSFIVIKDDTVLFEKYYNGYSRESIVTSFSIAKSITSILVGMAIEDGFITGENEPITNHIPELLGRNERFGEITIRDLLTMSSGLRYEEGGEYRDDDITYGHYDLRYVAINETDIIESPGSRFLYNNYNPLLLGLILERAVGKPVTEYMHEKLWGPIGMNYDGSWSTDENGFEKMESGVNAHAIDFAKIGRLMLKLGNWNGEQIISSEWVNKSTQTFDTASHIIPITDFLTMAVDITATFGGE